MSLAELLPSIHALPRSDKFRLMQELIAELAQEEGGNAGENPVWSPYHARDVAANLPQLPEQVGTSASGSGDVISSNGNASTTLEANTEKTPKAITAQNEIDPNLIEVDGHLLFRCIDVEDWTTELQKAHNERLASF